jgi:hypothetical protein
MLRHSRPSPLIYLLQFSNNIQTVLGNQALKKETELGAAIVLDCLELVNSARFIYFTEQSVTMNNSQTRNTIHTNYLTVLDHYPDNGQ